MGTVQSIGMLQATATGLVARQATAFTAYMEQRPAILAFQSNAVTFDMYRVCVELHACNGWLADGCATFSDMVRKLRGIPAETKRDDNTDAGRLLRSEINADQYIRKASGWANVKTVNGIPQTDGNGTPVKGKRKAKKGNGDVTIDSLAKYLDRALTVLRPGKVDAAKASAINVKVTAWYSEIHKLFVERTNAEQDKATGTDGK